MSFGKSIGSYLVDIIKAERNKDCDMCIKRKLWNAPILACAITQKINLILKAN